MTFYIYKDRQGEWRWRLVSPNGRIIADSGQGYKYRRAMMATINRIRLLAHSAEVNDK
jgi:uncharacterized protein